MYFFLLKSPPPRGWWSKCSALRRFWTHPCMYRICNMYGCYFLVDKQGYCNHNTILFMKNDWCNLYSAVAIFIYSNQLSAGKLCQKGCYPFKENVCVGDLSNLIRWKGIFQIWWSSHCHSDVVHMKLNNLQYISYKSRSHLNEKIFFV